MQFNTSVATAAPAEIELGGDMYSISPLTEKDWGTFERWMQERSMQIASEASAGLPESDRKIILERAFDKADRLSVTSPEALSLMVSFDGASRLIWFGLKHNHPKITIEEVKRLLKDPKTVEKAMSQFGRLNAGPEETASDKKKEVTPPTTEAPSTATLPSTLDGTPTPLAT